MRGWSDGIIPLAAAGLALLGGEPAHGQTLATHRIPAAPCKAYTAVGFVPMAKLDSSGEGSDRACPVHCEAAARDAPLPASRGHDPSRGSADYQAG
jgi:hypothetical protein